MIHQPFKQLAQDNMTLREIVPEDADRLYAWRMNPINRPVFRTTGIVPFTEHTQFVARYFKPENHDAWFVVEVDGTPVGMIALCELDLERREAIWGRFVIEEASRRHGYGRRALLLLMNYARQIGVCQLRCEVLDGNVVAENLYRNLGFVEIGRYELEGRHFKKMTITLEGGSH